MCEANEKNSKLFCEGINENLSVKEFYSKIKLLCGGKKEVVSGVRDDEGNIVNELESKKKLWSDHYMKLGNVI